MENLQKLCKFIVLFIIVNCVSSQSVGSQRRFSINAEVSPDIQQPQLQSCGVQDKDELPDFHAAAPWAAALFYVEGDIFQNNLKPRYLGTAVFISRNLAITSGSDSLAEQKNALNSKLQLFYGHKASGKKTFIRIKNVERLSSESAQARRSQNKRSSNGNHLYLYLLQLDSAIDITSFSRPLCISENIFLSKHQHLNKIEHTNQIHISGYATKNETLVPKVYFTSDREWKISTWTNELISVAMTEEPLAQEFLPKNFYPGSALTVKQNNVFYLAGILIESSNSQTVFQSLEAFVKTVEAKLLEYSPQREQPVLPQPTLSPSALPQQHSPNTDPTITFQKDEEYSSEKRNANLQSQSSRTTPEYVLTTPASNYRSSTEPHWSHNKFPDFSSNFRSTTVSSLSKVKTQDKFVDGNGTVKCPPAEHLNNVNGTMVSCWTPNSSNRVSCSDALYPGYKAEFSCSRYYKSLLSTASVVKHCQSNGEWSLNRKFECQRDCGVPKSELVGHIVHGRRTDCAKWPWYGLIYIRVGPNNLTYICGSTLISTRTMITAAHCVTDRHGRPRNVELYKIVLAATSNNFQHTMLDNETQIFDVEKISVPPLFNPDSLEADIAMIQLSTQVTISDFVRPACISLSSSSIREQNQLSPGNVGTVIGFGIDETGNPSVTLKEASFPIVSYDECYRVSEIRHSSSQYCAGYTNGTTACNGDSGSGQFFEAKTESGKRLYLQGIVSHGNGGKLSSVCDKKYSVFTKVTAFKDWISVVAYELDNEF